MNTQIREPSLKNTKIVLELVNLSARERDVNDEVCSELESKGISVLAWWKASWTLAKKFLGDFKRSVAARVFATNMAMKHTVELVQVLGVYGISKEFTLRSVCAMH